MTKRQFVEDEDLLTCELYHYGASIYIENGSLELVLAIEDTLAMLALGCSPRNASRSVWPSLCVEDFEQLSLSPVLEPLPCELIVVPQEPSCEEKSDPPLVDVEFHIDYEVFVNSLVGEGSP